GGEEEGIADSAGRATPENPVQCSPGCRHRAVACYFERLQVAVAVQYIDELSLRFGNHTERTLGIATGRHAGGKAQATAVGVDVEHLHIEVRIRRYEHRSLRTDIEKSC